MAKKPVPKKTETLTLRLDPKMKFAIELLARDQKRTLAGVIEWAVQKALNGQEVTTGTGKGTLQQLVDRVWSPDDLERIIYLGAYAEHLLNHEESCQWQVIKSNPVLFKIHESDDFGRIKAFTIHRDRVAYARELIAERAQQLADTGQFETITYEQINEASSGEMNVWEAVTKALKEVDNSKNKPEGIGSFFPK